MATISKNIKRLRTARAMTQEQLAETLHVTRQTISSWENDRTQPDIDMLTALSAALDTDVEELIYGKKRRVGLEAPPADKRRTLSLVLIIMGSLLTAIGLIFLFVYFWQKLPLFMQTALSFLPMLAGTGAGLYAVLRKKEKIALREGAAVLWCAGVIASNALINSQFSVDFGFEPLLLADLLLLLPVPFLLQSVFAFTLETGLAVALMVHGWDDMSSLWHHAAAIAALAVLAGFIFKNRQPDPVKKYCAWLGLLSAGAALVMTEMRLEDLLLGSNETMGALLAAYAFFAALYVTGTSPRFGLRLRMPAAIVLCIGLVAMGAVGLENMNDLFTPYYKLSFMLTVPLACAAVCLVPAFLVGRRSFRSEPVRIAFVAVILAVWALAFVMRGEVQGPGYYLLSLAAGVLVTVAGVKKARLAVANLGMLQLTANLLVLLWGMDSFDYLWIGIVFIAIGLVFLFANRKMIKKFEAQKKAAAEAAAAQMTEETEKEGEQNDA